MSTLDIRNISLGYTKHGQTTTLLHDFNLSLTSGEIVSLLGASGVGKSSLLRVIAGLTPPLSGEVMLFGERLTRPHPRVGFVFQQAALLPWLTVHDNVAFGLDFTHQAKIKKNELNQRVTNALKEVGLENAAQKYPKELSGGMAQRAALARGIVRQPQVLLLDEPFSALDAVVREHMQLMLRQIVQHHKTAALLVTHDIDEALLISDRIILVGGNGRISGTWQPNITFPRTGKLHELQQLRTEILESLHFAQQNHRQTQTVEFII